MIARLSDGRIGQFARQPWQFSRREIVQFRIAGSHSEQPALNRNDDQGAPGLRFESDAADGKKASKDPQRNELPDDVATAGRPKIPPIE